MACIAVIPQLLAAEKVGTHLPKGRGKLQSWFIAACTFLVFFRTALVLSSYGWYKKNAIGDVCSKMPMIEILP